jgi:O-antigen ligase
LQKGIKIASLYCIVTLFVALCLFLVVEKSMYLMFALPILLGVLMLYILSYDKVLFLIAFLTPLSINLEGIGLSLSVPVEPLLFGVLFFFIAKLLYEKKFDNKIAYHPISIVIYLMFIWIIITTITSELPLVSIKYLLSRIWFIIPAYFVCAKLFKDPKNINKFVWFYIAGLIIVILYTIYNHALNGFSGKSSHWVMTPFYNDHTAYGAALAIYLVMNAAFIFMPNIKTSTRIIIALSFALLCVAMVLSSCRAAWLSIIAVIGVLICVLLKIKFKYIFTIIIAVVAIFFTFRHQIIDVMERNEQDSSSNFLEHVQSMTNISTDASNLERINRWSSALRLFEERPFFGWGPGTYQFVYAPYQLSTNKTAITTNHGDGGNAHSEYIGALAEMGVIGSFLVILLVVVSVYKGLTTYKKAKNKESKIMVLAATLAIISYFVHGVLNNFLDTDKLAIPVWSCLAIITVIDTYHSGKTNYYDSISESQQALNQQ